MKIPSIKYSESGKNIYLGLVSASKLVKNSQVDAWSPENPKGYQRSKKIRRSKRFADFIAMFKGVFHQTVLLNVRKKDVKKISFKSINGTFGILELRCKPYIVDGQHRLGGIDVVLSSEHKDQFVNFPIPVLIFSGLTRVEEALQFFIVNRTQVGVRTDLSDRLIADVIGKKLSDELLKRVIGTKERRDLTEEAVQLTDELNKNDMSIWKGRIALPEQKIIGNLSVSQRSFTQSVKQILKDDFITSYFENLPDDIVDPLIDYWEAIKQLCSKAMGLKFRDYVLLKTTGPFVMHKLFPHVYQRCVRTPTVKKMVEILARIEEMHDEDWHKGGAIGKAGTNMKSFNELYKSFLTQIVSP